MKKVITNDEKYYFTKIIYSYHFLQGKFTEKTQWGHFSQGEITLK